MPKVTIRPKDIVVEAATGTTIMKAAEEAGYYWPTTCGGEGRCTTCACVVVIGMGNLSPMGRAEERVLVDERGPTVLKQHVRLACQAQLNGDVEVQKTGVRDPYSLGLEES